MNRTAKKTILDSLRSGEIGAREVLAMGTEAAGKVRLRDLCELGYGMSPANTGQLLLLMKVEDWANCRIEDCTPAMLRRFDEAFAIYEMQFQSAMDMGLAEDGLGERTSERTYAR